MSRAHLQDAEANEQNFFHQQPPFTELSRDALVAKRLVGSGIVLPTLDTSHTCSWLPLLQGIGNLTPLLCDLLIQVLKKGLTDMKQQVQLEMSC